MVQGIISYAVPLLRQSVTREIGGSAVKAARGGGGIGGVASRIGPKRATRLKHWSIGLFSVPALLY